MFGTSKSDFLLCPLFGYSNCPIGGSTLLMTETLDHYRDEDT